MTNPTDLTFYGHFTGASSYPVVCKALARWLKAHTDLRIANLRQAPVDDRELSPLVVPITSNLSGWGNSRPFRSGAGMLFGFPSWYGDIPAHSAMVGYHVGDVDPLPPDWLWEIERACTTVLTPSQWCAGLLKNLGVSRPIYVVPHGIDTDVFAPRASMRVDAPVVLRHFCSSPALDRKGTREVIRAGYRMLKEPGPPFVLEVLVPRDAPLDAQGMEANSDRGRILIGKDEPTDAQGMAHKIWAADVIVQPSRAEGFGCIPLEALACGRPVVTTNATGHAEWFGSVEDAVVPVYTGDFQPCGPVGQAPSLDEESLYEAMSIAVRSAENLQGTAMDRAKTIREQWSWQAILDEKLLPLLPDVLV